MNFVRSMLLWLSLGGLSVHLAGCAAVESAIQENPEMACAAMALAGGVIGYAVGDDAGAALAGVAVGALGCALLMHVGADNAVAAEEWKTRQLSPVAAPLDQQVSRRESLETEAGQMDLTIDAEQAQRIGLLGRDDLVREEGWPTDETYCREAQFGVTLAGKTTRRDTLECLTAEGDFRTVEVRTSPA